MTGQYSSYAAIVPPPITAPFRAPPSEVNLSFDNRSCYDSNFPSLQIVWLVVCKSCNTVKFNLHVCVAMESSIPVVDFSQMSEEKVTEDYSPESIQQLADEIHRAFSTVGFVYLKNHGIPQEKVREFTGKSL